MGEAFEYVRNIYTKMRSAGYHMHHWLLKGENMGVPQTRHRVFFVAIRNDLNIDPRNLDMVFNYEPVTYGDIKSKVGDEFSEAAKNGKLYNLFLKALPTEKTLCDVSARLGGKNSYFQCYIVHDADVLPTIRASRGYENYRYEDKTKTTIDDVIHAQTFPEDYDFGRRTINNVSYLCGMSAPPIMIKRIVTRLIEQGVYDYAKSV